MKKKSLYLLVIIVAAILLLILGTTKVNADTEITEGNFKYVITDNNKAKIKKYLGNESNVVIPNETLEGYEIVEISAYEFAI
jgi:hypothetical protein